MSQCAVLGVFIAFSDSSSFLSCSAFFFLRFLSSFLSHFAKNISLSCDLRLTKEKIFSYTLTKNMVPITGLSHGVGVINNENVPTHFIYINYYLAITSCLSVYFRSSFAQNSPFVNITVLTKGSSLEFPFPTLDN